jgi:hypothetical protein
MIYCLALLAPIVPAAVFGGSAWIAMNASGSAWPVYGIVAVLLELARFVFVLARPRALQAYPAVPLLRFLGIAAMIVGSTLALASLFSKPITLWLFGTSSDPGVGFLVIVAALSQGAYLATIGVVVFELNRAIAELKAVFARVIDRRRPRDR